MISIFGDSSLVAAAISSACLDDGVTTISGDFEVASHWFMAYGWEVTGAKNSPLAI